ncbi:hypothetical protein VTJ49DRAFT_4156 [Mycothermus thermophilus]|uniref:VWFA domain-containing protein n=1 Tax=Humicola insolens TaxID=85995 RepID=A0ABR3V6G0_HUMIN
MPDKVIGSDLTIRAMCQLPLAIDFPHSRIKVTHTDIHPGNFLLGISDPSIFPTIVDMERVKRPTAWKLAADGSGAVIHTSGVIVGAGGKLTPCITLCLKARGYIRESTMHLISNGLALLTAGLALASQALAQDDPQTNATCDPLFGRIDAGTGGRKVGIVIDASGSMSDNDPDDLRLQASKLLVDKLVSASEASGNQAADQVTVVEFTLSADVLYPLGDPDGAGPSIDGIYALGGTFIGGGIDAAVDELTKASAGTTAGRTGILVLTDGVDDPPENAVDTVAAINRAAGLGIRVNFGFLSVDSTQQNPEITTAILNSGGIFSTITSASDISKLVAQVLLNGLVGEAGDEPTTLLPGLDTAGLLSQTSTNTFTYSAQAGESFNLTIKAIDDISLKVTLKDSDGNELASAVTNDTGVAVVEQTIDADTVLSITVTGEGGATSGLFSVQISSSFDPCTEDPDDSDDDDDDEPSSFPACHGSFSTSYIPSTTSAPGSFTTHISVTPTSVPTKVTSTPSATRPGTVVTGGAAPVRDAGLAVGFGMLLPAAVFGLAF